MKNKVTRLAGVLLAVGGATIGWDAQASDPLSFQLGVASQYMGKGLGKSNEEPSVSGSVELSHNGFYASLFGATAEPSQGSDAEILTTPDYRTTVAGYGLDVSVINRDLPGTRPGVDANYTEYQVDRCSSGMRIPI